MESEPLKRVLDYKLVFDCLADGSNGMIPLQVLSARWPRGEEEEGKSEFVMTHFSVRRKDHHTKETSCVSDGGSQVHSNHLVAMR